MDPHLTIVKSLHDLKLLDASQVEELTRVPETRDHGLESTVSMIQRRGWMTEFQAEAVSSGSMKDLILGPYALLEVVGRGGMGVVYKAKHQDTGQLVAIKVIKDEVAADPPRLARFAEEAQILRRLRHSNIVKVVEIGESKGQPYLVMELLEGGSLDDWTVGEPGSFERSAGVIETLARAMQAVHAQQIIHRDLKPANVLFDAQGVPKVTDFGLAKLLDSEARFTRTGDVLGTPAYMAPEQAAGQNKRFGPATDVHALGVILYELLTGKRPFAGSTTLEIIEVVRTAEPAVPSTIRPGLPKDLETICLKCLEKEPEHRYPTAEALADDLRRFLNASRVQARRAGVTRKASKWRRRNPARSTLLIAGVALAFASLAAGLWYFDAYQRPKVGYFRDYVSRLGVPEGRGAITQAEAGRRASSFRITSRGGRVEQLEVVDGLGRLSVWSGESATLGRRVEGNVANRECRYAYQRKADGSLDREVAFDKFGNQLWALQYNNSETANYLNSLGYSNARAASGATYLGYLRTPEGYAREIHYLNKVGSPLPNDDGVYGIRMDLDPEGRVLRQTFLDSRYKPTFNRTLLYTAASYTYDAQGLIVETKLTDTAGRPAVGKSGYAVERTARDEHGNSVEVAVFDGQDAPAFFKTILAHKIKTTHDARGFPSESAYFDAEGRPCVSKGGYARNTRAWDDAGNIVEERSYDASGRLAPDAEGFARVTAKFDERNRPVESRYWDAQGKPAIVNGYARMTQSLDDRGNILEEAYFDAEDRPVMATDGHARMVKTYDDRNNLLTAQYHGPDGKPTTRKEGYSGLRHKYDDSDNQTSTEYLGPDGKLVFAEKGYARTEKIYNDQGQMLSQSFFGPDGEPAFDKTNGAHGVRTTYDGSGNTLDLYVYGADLRPIVSKLGFARMRTGRDDRGLIVDTRLFDAEDRPMAGSSGFARKTVAYDDRGNKVDEATFDAKGKPVASPPEGVHRTRIKYDERNTPSEFAFFDVDGKPCYHQQEGFARAVAKTTYGDRTVIESLIYDAEGRPTVAKMGYQRTITVTDLRDKVLERRYLDADGKPMANKEGFSRQVSEFDGWGNETRISFFGVDGKPVFVGSLGCAVAEKRYDERGNNTEEASFGPDGRPVLTKTYGIARAVREFDALNRMVEIRYLDADGKPMLSNEFVARATYRYDDRGNTTEAAFFDAEGRPTISNRQFSRMVQSYDERNKPTELRRYGKDGKLARDDLGIAVYRYERDAMGRMIAESFFGPDEKPTASKLGPARVTYAYDESGNKVEEAYFDVAGKPTRGEVGVSRIVSKFDRLGNKVEQAIFDPSGKPMADGAGIARRVGVHDARGNLLEDSRFDVEGKLAADRNDGIARRVARFNDRNQQIEVAAFGPDGRPCKIKKLGGAMIRSTYDARGNPSTVITFDEEGKPTPTLEGPAGIRFVYDEMGRLLDEDQIDVDGKPALSKDGFARSTNRYGPRGFVEEVRYFGVDGKPILIAEGYCRRLISLSDDYTRREQTYLGLDDAPVATAMGYARIVEEFVPATSEVAAESYFGPDGRPVLGKKGYARVVRARDDRNRPVGERYFGVDGKPLVGKDGTSGYLSRLDDQGREVEKTYYNAEGKPGPNSEGLTRVVTTRDDQGREIAWRYFGPDGAPTLHKNGYSGIDREFHASGRPAHQVMFALDGTRLMKVAFDDQMKHATRIFYRHPTNKPAPTHYTSLAPVVVERPNLPGPSAELTLFDVEGGQPLVHPDGYHGFRNFLDARGRVVGTKYFGVDGQPVLLKDGWSGVIYKLDDAGRRVASTFFGPDDRPGLNRYGFAVIRQSFDAQGRVLEESFFDAENHPVNHKKFLYSRAVSAFDDRGNETRIELYGADGKPIDGDGGFARLEKTYDAKGAILSAAYHAADGRALTAKVTVREVYPGTPGEKLGMKPGDILVEYDGWKLDCMVNYLLRRKAEPADGPPRECKVLREGRELTVRFPSGILGLGLIDRVQKPEPAKP